MKSSNKKDTPVNRYCQEYHNTKTKLDIDYQKWCIGMSVSLLSVLKKYLPTIKLKKQAKIDVFLFTKIKAVENFVNEHWTIVWALKHALMFSFPVHGREQFGFLFFRYWDFFYWRSQEPASPSDYRWGELAVMAAGMQAWTY